MPDTDNDTLPPDKPPYSIVLADVSKRPHADFLTARRVGIGSSDIAAVLGLDPWRTPFAVWAEKTGAVDSEQDSEPLYWGRSLEPAISRRFAEDHVDDFEVFAPDYIARSNRAPFMLASPDRLLSPLRNHLARVADGPGSPNAILELKTTSDFANWEGELPDHYQLQVIWQQDVVGMHETAHVAVFTGTRRGLSEFEVDYDEAIAKDLRRAGRSFWKQVQENTPPHVTGDDIATLREVYSQVSEGEVVELPAHVLGLLEMRTRAAGAIKGYKSELEDIAAEIMALLGEAEVGTINGDVVVTWKHSSRKEHVVKAWEGRTLRYKEKGEDE